MYERFTDPARKAIARANQEALRLNHEFIGTEHILLGIVGASGGVAADVLSRLGVDFARTQLEVGKLVRPGPDMVTMGRLPMTPRAKKVVQFAYEVARDQNCPEIGTEHLLLAIVQESDGVASQVLLAMGLTPERLTREISQAMGITDARSRFTDRAQRAMELATQEARRLNHDYIGTEHILLGLMSEGTGVGANVLTKLGLDLATLRAEVEKLAKPGEEPFTADQLAPGPRARSALQHAVEEEGTTLNQGYVGTEHLLLGLLHEPDGVAYRVLANLGFPADRVRSAVLELLSGPTVETQPADRPEIPPADPFERFSDFARTVMELADQEATRFNHEYVGTEHLFLAIVKEGSGVGAKVLESFDLDLRKIRLKVEKLITSGRDHVVMSRLPRTAHLTKVVEYAMEESRRLQHRYVGTGHLLLGLILEEDGIPAQILMNMELTVEEMREAVVEFQGAVD